MRPALGPRFSAADAASGADGVAQPLSAPALAATAPNSSWRRLTPSGGGPNPSQAAQCRQRIEPDDPDCSMGMSPLSLLGKHPHSSSGDRPPTLPRAYQRENDDLLVSSSSPSGPVRKQGNGCSPVLSRYRPPA